MSTIRPEQATGIKQPLDVVAARTHERQQYVVQRPHSSSEPIRGSASDRFPATRTFAADPEATAASTILLPHSRRWTAMRL